MKKILSLLLVACMLLTVLAGCGNTKETDNETESESKTEELELAKVNLEGQSARKVVYDYMYAMSQVKWTTDTVINLEDINEDLVFRKNTQYTGIPYTTDKAVNLEQFKEVLDETGKYTGPTTTVECMGNHCSSSIIWAWRQVSDTIRATYTGTLMPNANKGTVIVGDYTVNATDTGCQDIMNNNTLAVMCEAYTNLQMGDAVLSFWPEKKTGHVRMVKEVYVEKSDSGVISAGKSYIVTTEQTNSFDSTNRNDKTTWWVEHKYTFNDLYTNLYIPITVAELRDSGELPEVSLKVSGFNTAQNILKGKLKGIIYSNYIIHNVTATVTDASGNVVWTQSFCDTAPLGDDVSGKNKNFTFSNNDVEALRNLPDGEYEYRVSVKLAYGTQDAYAIKFTSPAADE